mgnify:CR=1 FL=1
MILPDYIEARVAITADGVTYRDHSLQNLQVGVAMKDGVISFDRLVMDAFGGHTDVRGEVQFDEGQVSDIVLHGGLSFQKLDIGKILEDLTPASKPAGGKKTPADHDLVASAVDMVRREKQAEVQEKAAERAEERLLDLLLPPARPTAPLSAPAPSEGAPAPPSSFDATREKQKPVGIQHLVGPYVRVVDGDVVALLEGDAEERVGDVEGGLSHRAELEVGPDRLLVEVVRRRA